MALPASELTRDISVAGAKTAPPVLVSVAASLGGLTLNDWLAVATIAYVLLQAGYLVWKWAREWNTARRLRKDEIEALMATRVAHTGEPAPKEPT